MRETAFRLSGLSLSRFVHRMFAHRGHLKGGTRGGSAAGYRSRMAFRASASCSRCCSHRLRYLVPCHGPHAGWHWNMSGFSSSASFAFSSLPASDSSEPSSLSMVVSGSVGSAGAAAYSLAHMPHPRQMYLSPSLYSPGFLFSCQDFCSAGSRFLSTAPAQQQSLSA
jgi:hypothetical protein